MNQSFHLYQLQKVDQQLQKVEKRIEEIDAMIRRDQRILSAEKVVQQQQLELDRINKELRELEEIGKAIRLEVETNESALYAGKIQNPKELNDLQQKINFDKKNLDRNEEAQLDQLMKIEEQEELLGNYRKELVRVKGEVATSHSLLMGEKSQLLKQKETLETERSAKSTSIPEATLKIYTQLLQEKHGVAVALVEDLSCTMCGAPLTPGEWQNARSSSSLSFCSSCGRILYAS